MKGFYLLKVSKGLTNLFVMLRNIPCIYLAFNTHTHARTHAHHTHTHTHTHMNEPEINTQKLTFIGALLIFIATYPHLSVLTTLIPVSS